MTKILSRKPSICASARPWHPTRATRRARIFERSYTSAAKEVCTLGQRHRHVGMGVEMCGCMRADMCVDMCRDICIDICPVRAGPTNLPAL